MSDAVQIVGLSAMMLILIITGAFTDTKQEKQQWWLTLALILGVMLF